MPLKFFMIPVTDNGQAEQEVNAFLRGHRVLHLEKRFLEEGCNSFWSLCINFVETRAPVAAASAAPGGYGRVNGSKPKVDYKEVLKPEDFAVFARLRDVRKDIATAEAVPVYTIFNNEQLAQMVRQRATTKGALEKIAGVGDARLEKYGGKMLEVLAGAWKPSDEASGKAV